MQHALRKLSDAEQDEQVKKIYEWSLQDVNSRLNPVELSKKQMKKYTGTFGPRRIFFEDGRLWYQRDKGARHLLLPMGEDLFRLDELDYFRLSFGRDAKGKIVKVIGLYDNGRTDENAKN